MHKKFEINQTKIKGSCQSERKVVTHNSKSDLPLVDIMQLDIDPYGIMDILDLIFGTFLLHVQWECAARSGTARLRSAESASENGVVPYG